MTPTYLLYCEELPERKAAALAHLASHHITPILWRSFHGATWGLRTTKFWEYDSPPFSISPAQVGLMLGHYSLWQHLQVIGVESAVIFEDDVQLADDYRFRLAQVRKVLPADWQFLFLGQSEPEENFARKVTTRLGGGLVKAALPFGTHAYMVRRSALPVLLDRMAEASGHIDLQLWCNVLEAGLLSWYAVTPTLARQRTQTGEWKSSC